MAVPPALEKEIVACDDCWVFDPDNQPSVARRLDAGEEFTIWTLKNGMTFNFGLGDIPMWSDFVLCPKHEAEMPVEV